MLARLYPGISGLSPVCACLLTCLYSAHGGTVQTFDGKSFDGEIRFSDAGALVVNSTQHESVTIELTNVSRARFASGPFFSSGSVLPNGWTATDLGETRGFARLDGDAFTFRVEGQSTNATACHFVARAMPSDGQLVARIDQIAGNGTANAGIMIRGHSSSMFAALSLANDGKLWFHRRPDNDRRETKLTAGPSVSAPVWLKLEKSEKTIAALYSIDGRSWQTFATDTVKLPLERTWRETEGDLYLLRASCGVFASSRGKDTMATARVAPVNMMLHGLLGEYFGDRDFQNLKLARLDPQIRFSWGQGSPDPSLDKENFSVRWTGKLMAPRTGLYSFYFDADDQARLWINGEERPQVPLKKLEVVRGRIVEKQLSSPPMQLLRGQPVDVRMEFENAKGLASVKLAWALPGQTPEIIGMTNFLYRFSATNSPESIALARLTNNGPGVRGVLLRDGSFVAGTVKQADSSAVRVSFAGRKDVPVLSSKVARIILRPPQQPLDFEITHGRTGVFMKNGDFFESEFVGVEWNALTMSSVLFGMKRFSSEGSGESLVLVLNDVVAPKTQFEVRTLDGSVFHGVKVTAHAQTIQLEEPLLGEIAVPVTELYEIRALEPRVASAAASTSRP